MMDICKTLDAGGGTDYQVHIYLLCIRLPHVSR